MRTKGCGPRNLGAPKGSPFKLDPATIMTVASMAKGAKEDKDSGDKKETTTTTKPVNPKDLDVSDPFEGVPYRGTPLKACWKTGGPGNQGYVQRGMKKKGNRTVPNCVPKASAK